MATRRPFFLVLAALCAVGICVACGGDDDPPANTDTGTGNDGSVAVGCSNDSRVKPFASGMEAKSASGKLAVQVLSAEPSPPQRGAGDAGVNAWTLKITVDGQPATGTVDVATLMPDHGHGSPKPAALTANGDGTYALSNLFLFMAGVWEISFKLPDGETAKLTICVN